MVLGSHLLPGVLLMMEVGIEDTTGAGAMFLGTTEH